MLSETVWSLGYVAELASKTLSGKLFWDDVQYVALLGLLTSIVTFVWQYGDIAPRRPLRWLALIMALPVATVLLVLTDPLHHAARATARIDPAPPFGTLIYDFVALEWALVVHCYALCCWAAWALARALRTHHRHHRLQSFLIIAGMTFPMFSSVAGIFLGARLWLGQRDVAPAAFGIGALAITWAMSRKRFFDLAPVARHVVFGRLPDPVFVLDLDERVVDLNPCAQLLLGPEVRAVGKSVDLLVPDASRARRSLATGAQAELTVHGRTFEALSEPLDPNGAHGRVVILRDISARKAAERSLSQANDALEQRVDERTRALNEANQAMMAEIAERKRAEVAARASEVRFRALFDNSVQLMAVVAADGRIVAANRTALDLAGRDASQVHGLFFWEGPWWRHSSAVQDDLRAATARALGGELVKMAVSHVDRHGAQHEVDFSLKPLPGVSPEGAMLIAEARDITALRLAEQERATLKEALFQAQRLESIGRLAGGIAHDFNNLLTVIIGQIEVAIGMIRQQGDATASLEDAIEAGMTAASLTRQLLAFARKQPTAPRVLALNDVVAEAERILRRLIGAEVRLTLALSSAPLRVSIDRGQLEQVLINLAVNARDAMPTGGVLRIATDEVSVDEATLKKHGLSLGQVRYARLRVVDAGIGMTADVLEKVFEPFFTTKAAGKGTGIGLSTVFSIVQDAGGFITVQSQPAVGTTFDVHLPVTDLPLDATTPLPPNLPIGGERIVLVEDQAALRDLVSDQLRTLGYTVSAYARAEDALVALSQKQQEADLLVTDVVLAGMSGTALVHQLRQHEVGIEVLYVSGYTNDAVFGRGTDGDGARLLHKPFTLRELAQAVRATLDGTK